MATDSTRTQRLLLGGLAAVIAVLAAAFAFVLASDGDTAPEVESVAPTTTAASNEGTVTTTAVPDVSPADVDTSTVVWPWATSDVRYDDPVEAAHGFALDFVGFQAPVLGEFRQGDARSGEVDVKPLSNGPTTTVLVRQLEDNHWWVVGSVSSFLQFESPRVGDRIASPGHVTGHANAFEGHVPVTVHEDGSHDPIGEGFVTACQGEMCPFAGDLSFDVPSASSGAVVLWGYGGEDNQVWQASVMRVAF